MTREEYSAWQMERAFKNKAEGRVETPPEITPANERAISEAVAKSNLGKMPRLTEKIRHGANS